MGRPHPILPLSPRRARPLHRPSLSSPRSSYPSARRRTQPPYARLARRRRCRPPSLRQHPPSQRPFSATRCPLPPRPRRTPPDLSRFLSNRNRRLPKLHHAQFFSTKVVTHSAPRFCDKTSPTSPIAPESGHKKPNPANHSATTHRAPQRIQPETSPAAISSPSTPPPWGHPKSPHPPLR